MYVCITSAHPLCQNKKRREKWALSVALLRQSGVWISLLSDYMVKYCAYEAMILQPGYITRLNTHHNIPNSKEAMIFLKIREFKMEYLIRAEVFSKNGKTMKMSL